MLRAFMRFTRTMLRMLKVSCPSNTQASHLFNQKPTAAAATIVGSVALALTVIETIILVFYNSQAAKHSTTDLSCRRDISYCGWLWTSFGVNASKNAFGNLL